MPSVRQAHRLLARDGRGPERQAQAAQKAAQREAAAKKTQKEAAKRKLETQRNRAKVKNVSTTNLDADGKAQVKAYAQKLQSELSAKVKKAKSEKEIEKLKNQYQAKLQQEVDRLAKDPATAKPVKQTTATNAQSRQAKQEAKKETIQQTQDQAQAVVDSLTEKMKTMNPEERKQAKENLRETITHIEEIYDKLLRSGRLAEALNR